MLGTKTLTLNVQSLHSEVLQPLAGSVSSGYNGTLLICGVNTETTRALTDHGIIRQVEPKPKIHHTSAGFTFLAYYYSKTLILFLGLVKSV